jgi:hypothetical protein
MQKEWRICKKKFLLSVSTMLDEFKGIVFQENRTADYKLANNNCCDHELSSLTNLAQPAMTVFKAVVNL